MNWRSFDLNLLIVFETVARERSVARAASRLNMSPSALSHALARLRVALGDELFTRAPAGAPAGMELTPRAVELLGPVRAAIELLEQSFAPVFDPATSRHEFTVALDNRSALTLAAPLARHVAGQAPNVTLDLVPSGTLDIPKHLERGDFDAVVTCVPLRGAGLDFAQLFEDDCLVLLRSGHPAAAAPTISASLLARTPHLALTSTGESGDFVDAALAAEGLARHIELRAPLHSAPAILRETDMIAVVGRRTAQTLVGASNLATVELPFPSPRSVTSLAWHRRWSGSPAHRWLRDVVRIVATTE